MQFTEMGNESGKTLMLLPGTCCDYQTNFAAVQDRLAEKYHLICVNYDGFDGSDKIFPDMITVTEKIERYIIDRHNSRLDGALGSSLGCSFVGQMIQVYHDADRLDRLSQAHLITEQHFFLVKDILHAKKLIPAQIPAEPVQMDLLAADLLSQLLRQASVNQAGRSRRTRQVFEQCIICCAVFAVIRQRIFPADAHRVQIQGIEAAHPLKFGTDKVSLQLIPGGESLFLCVRD